MGRIKEGKGGCWTKGAGARNGEVPETSAFRGGEAKSSGVQGAVLKKGGGVGKQGRRMGEISKRKEAKSKDI